MKKSIVILGVVFILVIAISSFRGMTVHAASCFAICAHSSHGTAGWTGPLRTGANASDDAAKDAAAHNKANPGHDASSSCN
jgi:hypothetical protein